MCDGWGKGEVVGSERPALGVCGRCGVRRSGDAEVCDCGEQGMGGELGRDPSAEGSDRGVCTKEVPKDGFGSH